MAKKHCIFPMVVGIHKEDTAPGAEAARARRIAQRL